MTTLLRFSNLVERGIVNNRTTLHRWIDQHGFPAGIKIGPNSRAWPVDEIDAWLQERAAERDASAA